MTDPPTQQAQEQFAVGNQVWVRTGLTGSHEEPATITEIIDDSYFSASEDDSGGATNKNEGIFGIFEDFGKAAARGLQRLERTVIFAQPLNGVGLIVRRPERGNF